VENTVITILHLIANVIIGAVRVICVHAGMRRNGKELRILCFSINALRKSSVQAPEEAICLTFAAH